jgi:two-component system, OmpR family, response regulator
MITADIICDLRKILVIEDEGDMRLLLEIILNSDTVKVTHAKNLFDAMQSLKQEEPSLVLLDNRLPDGFGVDFIKYIKFNYPGIKIILITGIDTAVEEFALEAGADTFLCKPFSGKQLKESIEHLLN